MVAQSAVPNAASPSIADFSIANSADNAKGNGAVNSVLTAGGDALSARAIIVA